jgi:hypothetical protein
VHRTQRTRLVTSTGVLAGALFLAGCSATSPQVITTPYSAADGINASLGNTGVALRNMLVVGTAKGAPASVIGAIINNSDAPIQVSLQADLGESAQPSQTVIKVPAHGALSIGPKEQTQMTIPDLPVIPGATTGISAATLNGGRADLDVPVLAPSGPYASLAPAPTTGAPSPSVSKPSQNKEGGAGVTGTQGPEGNPGDNPAETESVEPTPTAT